MLKIFKNLFHKESEIEKEEKLENEIIQEAIQAETELKPTAIVIMYAYDDIEDSVPQIQTICEFHNAMLPDKDSIIWCPNGNMTSLLPYKVIRYDYIEDPNTENNIYKFAYIVVRPATNSDILIEQ